MQLRNGSVPQARFQQQSSAVAGARCSQDSLRNNRVPQRFPGGTVAFRCVQKAFQRRKQLAERIRSANLTNLTGAPQCRCGTAPCRRNGSSSSLLRLKGRGVPRIPCGTIAFRSVFLAERLRSAAFKKLFKGENSLRNGSVPQTSQTSQARLSAAAERLRAAGTVPAAVFCG